MVRVVEEECPAGFWCTAGKRIECTIGTYNNKTDQHLATACIQCPMHSTTLREGSINLADCVCEAGYFNNNSMADHAADSAVDCQPCQVGTSCNLPGTTLRTLNLTKGYWRPSPVSTDVRRCPDAAVNCWDEGRDACDDTHSGCRGGADFETQCAAGLRGLGS